MVLFFVKQKTAYEMRISDWSSDVCSSDLQHQVLRVGDAELAEHRPVGPHRGSARPVEGEAQLVAELELGEVFRHAHDCTGIPVAKEDRAKYDLALST